ncbi:MAG: hypothetical protein HXY50_11920 [Ignavibacteriaceae bacterium]|nr:hypothetical protein [Ignavibacteriaceae bacterium]
MNDKCSDTYDKVRQTRRDQLIDQCLQAGMPVTGDEDEETLEMYVEMAYDDECMEFDVNELDFCTDDESNESSNKQTSMSKKIVSLFM